MRIATDKGVLMILVAALLSFGVSAYFGPISQLKRMKLAQDHADKLTPAIGSDARFLGIRLGKYTGQGGMFSVSGFVATDSDLDSLRQLIEASRPPVKTHWIVHVVGPEFQRMTKKASK